MGKTEAIILKVEPEIKAKLQEIAAAGDGNLSALVREMIRENLKDRQCREMIRKAERPEFPHGEFDNGAHWMASND